MTYKRTRLGDFSSVVCFKAVITGIEDIIGEEGAGGLFIRAGKSRGHKLAAQLDIVGSQIPFEEMAVMLDLILGEEGTRLANVHEIYEEDGKIIVKTTETVCSAGEEMGSSRTCTFTLGAIGGVLEAVTGRMLTGTQTQSVLRGGEFDRFEFEDMTF